MLKFDHYFPKPQPKTTINSTPTPNAITSNVITQLVPIQNQYSGLNAVPNAPLLQNNPASATNDYGLQNFIKATNPDVYKAEEKFDSVLNFVDDEINKDIKKTKNKKAKKCLICIQKFIKVLHFIGIILAVSLIFHHYFTKSETAIMTVQSENNTSLYKLISSVLYNISKHQQPFIIPQNVTVLKSNNSEMNQKKKTQTQNNSL